MSGYDHRAIESKWQKAWDQQGTYTVPNPGEPGFDPAKPKFYVLDMFPYPSGAGLHVGHPLGYIATDIVARFHRMKGHQVLHPMGFDAFGLPAEQYAVEHGVHPRETTESNIANMRRQLRSFGLCYDWTREIATIEPEYYRWTQWIFLQLFHSWFDPDQNKAAPIAELERQFESGQRSVEDGGVPWSERTPAERAAVLDDHRLAFVSEVPVNWCPQLGTVLANEEVTAEGRSERGNYPVYRRPLKQWMLRITAYAQRLLDDLEQVDWPDSVKEMQRNWIGRSEGARVEFATADGKARIPVFTTRPDTLFGATYMVLAPDHPLVDDLVSDEQRGEVVTYRKVAAARSERDRLTDSKTKTGVFTGSHAINPVNGEKIPIWIADYVLMGYGTGAIMAVPAHDQRDFEFARQFGLALRVVVDPPQSWLDEQGVSRAAYREDPAVCEEAFAGIGQAIHSTGDGVSLDGQPTAEAKKTIIAWLEQRALGQGRVQFKLRDWLFSRQRYWGEPIPVLHGPGGSLRALDESELPLELPPMQDFKPVASDDPDAAPQPALSRAPEDWRVVEVDGVRYERELNTMPQWAGSCWYYLRFADPHNGERLASMDAIDYWMGDKGVDLYVGGVEHAVLHLLYARFWHKVLFDLGHVSSPEPFYRLFNQGYILAAAYTDDREVNVPAEEVVEKDGQYLYQGQPVSRSMGKMGKSLKNAVSPDDVIEEYGCDTMRLYLMYLGPIEESKPWSTRDIVGVHRFLQRVWRNFVATDRDSGAETWLVSDDEPSDEIRRALHKTIDQVTQEYDKLRFNTAAAKLIELNNELVPLETIPRAVADPMVRMLAPMAPHLAEELWQRLGHADSVTRATWPAADPEWLVDDTVEVVVQVMGKKRGAIQIAPDLPREQVEALAREDESVARHLDGKTVRKVIYVPKRLVNFVAT